MTTTAPDPTLTPVPGQPTPLNEAPPDSEGAQTEAAVGRLFEAALGALDLFSIHLGDTLGCYAALAERALTSDELAAACGIHPRYAREWLEQQAATGFLTVDDVQATAGARSYRLPEHLHPVLLEPTSPAYLVPIAGAMALVGQMFDQVAGLYRTGGGISWTDFPRAAVEVQGAFNRAAYTHDLPGWLASIPQVHDALGRGGRVADVACGVGWSTLRIAELYPQAEVRGFDLDDAAIAAARRNLAGSDVAPRVSFEVCDLSAPGEGQGQYDVITMFEALHDLSHPMQVLDTLRQCLTPNGVLLVMDEGVGEEFSAPAGPVERLMYGCSLFICLPGSMADGGVGTGTVMRPATLRGYAEAAGFSAVDVLPIEHDLFRFYLLRP